MLKFDATPISMFKIPCSVFDIQCDTRRCWSPDQQCTIMNVVGQATNNGDVTTI